MSKYPKPDKAAALTDLEHQAMEKSGELAMLVREIIGEGPNAYHDWFEATVHIHTIQDMILSQAACRAYPTMYRLRGQKLQAPTIEEQPKKKNT